MTERVHPNLPPPPSLKPHPYRPAIVEPQPYSSRRWFICLWSTIVILAVLLLAAIVATALYVVYRPRHPQFSPTSLKISSFNLSTAPYDGTTRLTTSVNLTISTKNPNAKITFFYDDPIEVTLFSPSDVALSNGSFSGFNSTPGSINVLHATMSMTSQLLDTDSVSSLKADLQRRIGWLKIVMDTRVRVKMEKKLKLRRIGIRVVCDGIRGMLPKGKRVISSNTSKAKCEVDFRILKPIF